MNIGRNATCALLLPFLGVQPGYLKAMLHALGHLARRSWLIESGSKKCSCLHLPAVT